MTPTTILEAIIKTKEIQDDYRFYSNYFEINKHKGVGEYCICFSNLFERSHLEIKQKTTSNL